MEQENGWVVMGSNHRPRSYQERALPLSQRPKDFTHVIHRIVPKLGVFLKYVNLDKYFSQRALAPHLDLKPG